MYKTEVGGIREPLYNIVDDNKNITHFSTEEQLRQAFQEKGFTVRASKVDEEIEDYIFVVEDKEGDIQVYHFYLAWLSLIPMVEIYLFNSFKKRERNKLRKRPKEFLESFDRYMLHNLADITMEEDEWLAQ